MKIQKITNNKIRIIFNFSEINEEKVSAFIHNSFKSKDLFYNILKTAKEKYNFDTKNNKLLIEGFTFMDNFIIFSITKLKSYNYSTNLTIKKKKHILKNNYIYKFDTLNSFLDFLKSLSTVNLKNFKKYDRNISLYKYKSNYYVSVKNVSPSIFNPLLSEFAIKTKNSELNHIHLSEYGKLLSKCNFNFLFNA